GPAERRCQAQADPAVCYLHPQQRSRMAESDRRLSLHIPWYTLLTVLLAVALVAVLVRVWYILTLILVAIIVAVGLQPAVAWLERRRWPRWAAASAGVFLIAGGIVVLFSVLVAPI